MGAMGSPGHFCGLDNAHIHVSIQTWLQSILIFVLIHQSQSGLIRGQYSVKPFMSNRRCARPTWACQASSPISGAAFLPLTLSTLYVGLHSSQSSIVKFTLNSQFLHFWCVFVICFSLEANMQARDPPPPTRPAPFTLFFPEFLFMKQKATVSLANYLPFGKW